MPQKEILDFAVKNVRVDGRQVREHRFVVEQYLGRSLTDEEIVHHINENTSDNRIENLQVMTPSEHTKLHWTDRKHTPETREKMRKSQQEYFADPVRSKKTRDAVSAANKKR